MEPSLLLTLGSKHFVLVHILIVLVYYGMEVLKARIELSFFFQIHPAFVRNNTIMYYLLSIPEAQLTLNPGFTQADIIKYKIRQSD